EEEADVEGVEDGAHAGGGEVELEMAVGVPAEGGDAVAGVDAEVFEGAGEAVDARAEVGVGVAVETVFGAGDDLFAREHGGGAGEDVLDGEGVVLHEALHGVTSLLWVMGRGRRAGDGGRGEADDSRDSSDGGVLHYDTRRNGAGGEDMGLNHGGRG